MTRQQKHERDADYLKRIVDKTIDAYEDGQHRTGGPVVQVFAFARELTFAAVMPNGDIMYRGRILLPVKPLPQRKLNNVQQDIEG